MTPDAEQIKLLRQARAKAATLVEELLKKQAEIEANPPQQIDAQSLAQGRRAMQKAVEAAQRTLDSLDDAMRVASISTN